MCARLDGLPLAIELAAARADLLSPRRSCPDWTTSSTCSPTTAERSRHDTVPCERHWTGSYDLLDDQHKNIFCDLSVFAGGFTLDMAEALVPGGHASLLTAVRTLLHASLLRPEGAPGDEPRFGMLETVREYGRERLEHMGRLGQLRGGHAKAFLTLAEQAESQLRGPDQVRWLNLLEAELPNIRAALHWAAHSGDADIGLLTAAGCGGSGRSAGEPTRQGATWNHCWPPGPARAAPAPQRT